MLVRGPVVGGGDGEVAVAVADEGLPGLGEEMDPAQAGGRLPRPARRGQIVGVAELLRRKRSLADAVLARGEGALTELSNEELLDLVALRRQP